MTWSHCFPLKISINWWTCSTSISHSSKIRWWSKCLSRPIIRRSKREVLNTKTRKWRRTNLLNKFLLNIKSTMIRISLPVLSGSLHCKIYSAPLPTEVLIRIKLGRGQKSMSYQILESLHNPLLRRFRGSTVLSHLQKDQVQGSKSSMV